MWLATRFVTQPSSLREVICGAYRIVYRVKAGSVEVVTVHHAARLLGA